MNKNNPNRCQAIVVKKDFISVCCNSKKNGDFCGIHNKIQNQISYQNLNLNLNDFPIKKDLNNSIITLITEVNNSNKKRKFISNDNTNRKFKKVKQKSFLIRFENFLELKESNPDQEKIENQFRKYLVNDYIEAYNFYKLDRPKGKDKMIEKLIKFFNRLESYKQNQSLISKIQKKYQKKILKNKLDRHGIGILDRSICNNHEEFFSFESLETIPDNYFFSFVQNGCLFGFDIRSFNKLIETPKPTNPYNNMPIDQKTKERSLKLTKYLEKKGLNLKHQEEIELTHVQRNRNRVVEVFQKIDHLDNYTNIEWILNLSIDKLKSLYRLLEDIWNYRAQLNESAKENIVPGQQIFLKSVTEIDSCQSYNKVLNYLIDQIDILVSSAPVISDRKIGAMYVLCALTDVSDQALEDMPYMSDILSEPPN